VILLDTHVWIWWVQGDPSLPGPMRGVLEVNEKYGLGVSVISCLEVARLVAYQRLVLPKPVGDWIEEALRYPHMKLLELTPQIAVASTQLPEPFHKDPADRIIVATARQFDVPLATTDGLIRRYEPNVKLV
jgi:PIN domain nuclease of toxin-antitoxin system